MVRVTHPFQKVLYVLIMNAVMAWFISVPVMAQIGTAIASGQTVTVDAHGECRQVTNAGEGTRMVFTGTAPEWQSFRDNPNGLEMAACTNCISGFVPRESYRYWTDIAASADGRKLVATVYNGQIYTSIDYGETWTPRDTNRKWTRVTSSADGTKLAAIAWLGVGSAAGANIFTSTDSGVTWTQRGSKRSWADISSSADGMKLVAGVTQGQIYTSTDGGVTWVARASNLYWVGVASSADGSKLVAVANSLNYIYTSTDSGVTWTQRGPKLYWMDVASSADGTKLVATGYNGTTSYLYTSTDSGVTWHLSQNLLVGGARVASSEDGQVLVTSGGDNKIYLSTDSGATWAIYSDSARYWSGVAITANGEKVFATVGMHGEQSGGYVDATGKIYVPGCADGGCGNDGLGVKVGGYCWYAGGGDESCSQTCAARGGVNMAGTRDYAGSGGSLAHCQLVGSALWGIEHALDQAGSTAYNSLGCVNGFMNLVIRTTFAPTTAEAHGPLGVRACACGEALSE